MKDMLVDAWAIAGGFMLAVVGIVGSLILVAGLLVAALWPLWLALAALKFLLS